jgi:5-(carboxyamino)imidazole ribonucleotide synthase
MIRPDARTGSPRTRVFGNINLMPAILPPASLGVIGGGQLGRMFAQAAQRLGYRVTVLASRRESPAAQIANDVVIGRPDDIDALKRFQERISATTVEFENVSAPALRWLAKRVACRPGWRAVWVSQNRRREKSFLARHHFPLARWRSVRSIEELRTAVAELGLPLILKTASSGYDGKGQIRVEREQDAEVAWSNLGRAACVAESVVQFACEVSVIVARGVDGRALAYPVCLNRHEQHILDSTVCPAPIGPIVSREASDVALGVAEALALVGVLTVEFFVTADGGLVINELAPRPHNSGHLTIEAVVTSQFEQQVRALCGLPLGASDLSRPAAMVNLLGDLWEHGEPRWEAALRLDPGAHLHLYGKRTPSPGRKMGHITVVDHDSETALARALAVRATLISR